MCWRALKFDQPGVSDAHLSGKIGGCLSTHRDETSSLPEGV